MARPLMTAEMSARVVETLNKRHGARLRDERFTVSGRLEEQTVVVTFLLERSDRTLAYEMQAAKTIPETGALTPGGTLDLCLDFLDWYLEQYFREDRDLLLPLDWQPHRFGEHEVMARGDVRNPAVEEAADAWLRGERPEVDHLKE
ncbi:MAG: hypothetical protein ACQEXJ_21350 [Myxococcota bacterium]